MSADFSFVGWEFQRRSFLVSGPARADVMRILRAPDPNAFHALKADAGKILEAVDRVVPAILLNPKENLPICDE